MSNQKYMIGAIIICTLLALLVSIKQRNINDKVKYNYYVVEDKIDSDLTFLNGYKLSNNISPIITDSYVRLELSALLNYNLNSKLSTDYSGDIFFDTEVKDLTNDYFITTAMNTLYKSDLLISTTKDEKEEYGYDYKISSLAVEKLIKLIFGNIEYDKEITNEDIMYNKDKDIYYYKVGSKKKNQIEAKVIKANESSLQLEVEVAIAYINYNDDKVYSSKEENSVLQTPINEKKLFDNTENYDKYVLTFIRDEVSIYHFDSIRKLTNEDSKH